MTTETPFLQFWRTYNAALADVGQPAIEMRAARALWAGIHSTSIVEG